MKNKINTTNNIIRKENVHGETTDVMETVLFTDTIKKEIKGLSPMRYSDCIPIIAAEKNLKVYVGNSAVNGTDEDIERVQDFLIKSVMYN